MYGYIVGAEGPWCIIPPMPAVMAGTDEPKQAADQDFYRIYPNPTTGLFTLELNGSELTEKYRVEIYDINGEKLLSNEITGAQKNEFSLSGKPAGIYLLRVVSERKSGTTRIIKQK